MRIPVTRKCLASWGSDPWHARTPPDPTAGPIETCLTSD
jgi:hypothetical protein